MACMFALSGFSGLVYESIWSHYLKLFLGHAAYAQTLVLAIYMGGMALGAWICSAWSQKWKNLLLGYAIVEAIIGIFALFFHESFVAFLQLAYSVILPNLSSALEVQTFKWAAAALLILPQTVLLGMTFPLMTAGLVRCASQTTGRTISLLYFANSIGAAIGVLVSGFLLIKLVGLPGAIKTAGIINIIIALVVWRYARDKAVSGNTVMASDDIRREPHLHHGGVSASVLVRLMLLIALSTGLASFIYEIGWVRMLNLVLGSSTHAFEMMLSAFILGLALGGFWLRNRIDRIKDPILYLAKVQMIMGVLAMATLPLYNLTFDTMQWIIKSLDKTDTGYVLFNLASHSIALAIMLPATFCAGITLPLLTNILLKKGYGEKSIGHVYAFNTVGAIAGVLVAVHFLMPLFGIKNLIIIGASIDIAIGIGLFFMLSTRPVQVKKYITPVISVVAVVVAITLIEFDSYKMASGVYRHGNFYSTENAELLFHEDGKTASVDLVRVKDSNEISIVTNGKPDASINISSSGAPSPDEATMVLLAALPLSLNPQANTAAVIGMGSGLTSHVLLSADKLQYVDTVEIEPAIVRAAQGFGDRVGNVFNLPNSHIYVDDAKSFFSTQNKRYDLIISEPSNPWVSGVAGLFTDEFYSNVSNYLEPGGIFAQWLQLYEIDLPLVASVLKAVSNQFSDYAIYATNNHDIVVLATKTGHINLPSDKVFSYPGLAQELHRVKVRNIQDLYIRKLGGKAFFEPFFQSYAMRSNSDYFPVLDLNAIKARFLKRDAMQLVTLRDDPVRIQAMLGEVMPPVQTTQTTPSRFYYPSDLSYAAMLLRNYLLTNRINAQFYKLPEPLQRAAFTVKSQLLDCQAAGPDTALPASLEAITLAVMPYLSPAELNVIWSRMATSPCFGAIPIVLQEWIQLARAVAESNAVSVGGLAAKILVDTTIGYERNYLLSASMIANIRMGDIQKAKQNWQDHGGKIATNDNTELLMRLLKSHSGVL